MAQSLQLWMDGAYDYWWPFAPSHEYDKYTYRLDSFHPAPPLHYVLKKWSTVGRRYRSCPPQGSRVYGSALVSTECLYTQPWNYTCILVFIAALINNIPPHHVYKLPATAYCIACLACETIIACAHLLETYINNRLRSLHLPYSFKPSESAQHVDRTNLRGVWGWGWGRDLREGGTWGGTSGFRAPSSPPPTLFWVDYSILRSIVLVLLSPNTRARAICWVILTVVFAHSWVVSLYSAGLEQALRQPPSDFVLCCLWT